MPKQVRLLNLLALREKGVYYAVDHLRTLWKAGRFPAPVKSGTRIFWVESEVDAWIAKLIAERDGKKTRREAAE